MKLQSLGLLQRVCRDDLQHSTLETILLQTNERPRACPSQLSRELQDIMKEQDPGLSADAVDDNVYQWDVLLGGFAPTSPLGQARSRPGRSVPNLWLRRLNS